MSERILDPSIDPPLLDVIADAGFDGIQSLDQSLLHLVSEGLMSEEDARAVATNPHDFSLAVRGELGPTRGVVLARGA